MTISDADRGTPSIRSPKNGEGIDAVTKDDKKNKYMQKPRTDAFLKISDDKNNYCLNKKARPPILATNDKNQDAQLLLYVL